MSDAGGGDDNHLQDATTLDPFALDELDRQGPKYGILLPRSHAATILSRLSQTLHQYLVSTLGYNNRLYYASTEQHQQYVIKICGRYWKHVKTETEVIGLWIASRYAGIPVPRVLAWDASGQEFGVEYVVMDRLEGVPLSEMWKAASLDTKLLLVAQIAHLVVRYKTCVPDDVLPRGTIGNFAFRGDKCGSLGGIEDFEIGATLEGLGPWCSYKAFLRSQLEAKLQGVRTLPLMTGMLEVLPRIERLLQNLDEDAGIVDSDDFVFTHGDLHSKNLLVTSPTSSSPQISAVLDWEWSGMFPAEEEFLAAIDFLSCDKDSGNHPELESKFFSILETGRVQTPRTIPHFEQRKALCDLRENLLPWYLTDHGSPNSPEALQSAQEAKRTVVAVLEQLNY
ncbi:hypothetical protein O6H91_19G077500 [Diphasiastrum complanatum]|uniref:Uncharacterized protein n=2 Tax=Diphasiastrum complanatum TaxID=34168 RepID=A0ACC2AWU6_DIPCM|nr:hypothetical protein O6H91_19G077300 [Diphasiastrum complanatum]KAJ7521984.1 hypothetical protein O6H91_19G077500 [Diphasiastrum complanatum]